MECDWQDPLKPKCRSREVAGESFIHTGPAAGWAFFTEMPRERISRGLSPLDTPEQKKRNDWASSCSNRARMR